MSALHQFAGIVEGQTSVEPKPEIAAVQLRFTSSDTSPFTVLLDPVSAVRLAAKIYAAAEHVEWGEQ